MKKPWSWGLTIALALFTIIVAVYVIFSPGGESPAFNEGDAAPVRGDFFAIFRQERSQARADENRYLDEMLEDSAVSAQAKSQAESAKLALVERIEDEFAIESTLLAKGYGDAAVTISDSGVSVVVYGDTLNEDDAAKILDIVCRQTGVSAQDVFIMPAK